jgi:hypothetical protein
MAHLLSIYRGSYAAALMDLLPNIGIDPSKFNRAKSMREERRDYCVNFLKTEGYWAMAKNRRQFFDNFAAKKNLDPLLPSTWYEVDLRHILRDKVDYFFSFFCH